MRLRHAESGMHSQTEKRNDRKSLGASWLQAIGQKSFEHWAVVVITVLWAIGVLLPIMSLVVISFVKGQGLGFIWEFTLKAYHDILLPFRVEIMLRTLRFVFVITLLEIMLAFPFALWLAKGIKPGTFKNLVLVALVVPFFLSPAARTIVWRSILGTEGMINSLLMSTGLINEPIGWLLFSEFSVHLGLIGPYFPSMVWPLFISFSLIDDELIKASRDLGASAGSTLLYIVVPLAMPGIIAGVIFTSVPMLGDNVSSALLGGGNVYLVAESFDSLIRARNYPAAAALASLLVIVMLTAFLGFKSLLSRSGRNNDVFQRLSQ